MPPVEYPHQLSGEDEDTEVCPVPSFRVSERPAPPVSFRGEIVPGPRMATFWLRLRTWGRGVWLALWSWPS